MRSLIGRGTTNPFIFVTHMNELSRNSASFTSVICGKIFGYVSLPKLRLQTKIVPLLITRVAC